MNISTHDLYFRIGSAEILKGISMDAENNHFIGVIGPNGSGKSTLLKCVYRVLSPSGGAVMLDGRPLSGYKMKESAKRMAVLGQHASVAFEFTALEIVLMGRSPHKRALELDNETDYDIAKNALAAVGMSGFEQRIFSTLSGGERQRVMLAQALAQQTPCLILDEPTNHLDIKYQLEIMNITKNLECTVISAIHDLNIAAMYCDLLYVLNQGKVVAKGIPLEVLTPELIRYVYEVDVRVIDNGMGGINIIFKPM